MVVSSGSLRLLIFLLATLTPACASSSQAFCMMYSAYKLNKQVDNIQPWHIPFPIENQSVVPCLVLTVASWPAYRFLRSQVRWSGIPISLRWTLGCLKTHKAKQNKTKQKTHKALLGAQLNLGNLPLVLERVSIAAGVKWKNAGRRSSLNRISSDLWIICYLVPKVCRGCFIFCPEISHGPSKPYFESQNPSVRPFIHSCTY